MRRGWKGIGWGLILAIPFWSVVIFFLVGCEATYQFGVGAELHNSEADFGDHKHDTWKNPTGVVGVSYPLMENLVVDYRHISGLGGSDSVTSDNLSLLLTFKGSKAGK